MKAWIKGGLIGGVIGLINLGLFYFVINNDTYTSPAIGGGLILVYLLPIVLFTLGIIATYIHRRSRILSFTFFIFFQFHLHKLVFFLLTQTNFL